MHTRISSVCRLCGLFFILRHRYPIRVLLMAAGPGVPPRDRDTLVVSTKSDVGAVVITDLHRLVFAQGNRSGNTDAGARLARYGIRDASQAGNAAEPEISVQRAPLSNASGLLRTHFRDRGK
jgi:hypothetical protein